MFVSNMEESNFISLIFPHPTILVRFKCQMTMRNETCESNSTNEVSKGGCIHLILEPRTLKYGMLSGGRRLSV